MDPAKPEILDKAWEELAQEEEWFDTEDRAVREHQELLESMKERPFWHNDEMNHIHGFDSVFANVLQDPEHIHIVTDYGEYSD